MRWWRKSPPPATSTADAGAVLQDTVRARRLGFGAKLCIHPNQVGAVHEGFAPTGRECSWADRVLGAVAAAGERAANFEGKMIDRPVIERARRIAALAKR
jgi:citrate lyase subunit beta/citryl-CoA lyase